MDPQSPIKEIDRIEFCSDLDDSKRSRQITASKDALKESFRQITCHHPSGRAYLSWMSKNWFCLALSVRVRVDWDLEINQQLDIVELAFRFPKQTQAILKMVATEDFSGVPENKSFLRRFKYLENHYCQTYLFGNPGGESSVYCDRTLKNLFLIEKEEFQAKYFERKLYETNQVSFRLHQLKSCKKCKAPFNLIQNGLKVCSRVSCSVGKRNIYDVMMLPNFLMKANIVGAKILSQEEEKYFRSLKPMPMQKKRNNIMDSLGGFKYTNQLVWRGSLANRTLSIPVSIVPYSLAGPILRAKNLEETLPLEIRQVSYIKEKANRGVFATMPLEKNTVVCVYSGQMMRVSESQFWQYNDSLVQFAWIDNDTVSLIPQKFANIGRFFNGVIGKQVPNMTPLWTLIRPMPQEVQLVLLLITSMDVPAGTELKWYYGNQFNKLML